MPASPIALENQAAGSDDYVLKKPANDQVAGYASAASIAAGDSLQLFVNVDQDQGVTWRLFRIGYYQGHGARLIATGEPTPVTAQGSCPIAPDTGLIECHWPRTFSIQTDPNWVSGYYVFKLVNDSGYEAYVPLIVRESGRRAPIVVQASVNTWQAYNLWGGTSLYKNTSRDPHYSAKRARRVSFDRPYEATAPSFMKELGFVRWLEERGYDASYVTNLDLEADRTLLVAKRRLFLTLVHDEYWSVGERDALDAARDAGVSLFFLSANTGYWRVRLDPSSGGVPRRVITCYKSADLDPNSGAPDTTVQFREPPNARPENALLGVMYGDWSDFAGFPFVVANAKHWIYEGTGVRDHEALSPIIGVEWDGVVDNGLTPAGLEVIGDSPAVSQVGVPFPHVQASVYYPTTDSLVFAAGSIDFTTGLEAESGDSRVQRMTENLFARAGFTLSASTPVRIKETIESPKSRETRVIAGGAEGLRDGLSDQAMFDSPAGVAAGHSGELYIADTGNQVVRKIDPAGVVTTVAGCAPGDAAPAGPCFDHPTGIAAAASGDVYISDTGHHRIWRLDSEGVLHAFAGSGTQGAADQTDPTQAEFANPRGLALGPEGELYVADFGNAAIRAIDAHGVRTLAHAVDGVTGVAVDPNGKLYFASSARVVLGSYDNGMLIPFGDQSVRPLEGLVATGDGLIVADTGNYRVQQFPFDSTQPSVTVIGDRHFGSESGQVVLPRGITPFDAGYAVADSGNHRIVWFSATPRANQTP